MRIGQHDTHPAADAYPMLAGDELKDFVASVKAHGRCDPHDPVVLLAVTPDVSLILDGRNRYQACDLLGFEPVFRYFDVETEGDPIEYVKRKNNDRRHQERISKVLSLQRLGVIAKREDKKAKQDWLPAVSKTDPGMFQQIDEDGEPELIEAVHHGEIDPSKAAALSQLDPAMQRKGLEMEAARRAEEERPEPIRAVSRRDAFEYKGGTLNAFQQSVIKAAILVAGKSVHGEAKAGADELKAIFAGLVLG